LKGCSGEVLNQGACLFLLLRRGRLQFTQAAAVGCGHVPSAAGHPALVAELKDSPARAVGLLCFLHSSCHLGSRSQSRAADAQDLSKVSFRFLSVMQMAQTCALLVLSLAAALLPLLDL